MSKKTSPQSRPARSSRSRGPSSARITSGSRTTGRGAASQRAPRSGASASGAKAGAERPTTFTGRLRRFAPVVGIPEAVIVLTILVLALGGLLLTATPMAYFPVTVGEMWLTTTLAPVVVEGVTVSFLPMLPAIGLVALLAYRIRRAIRARVSMIDLAVLLLCVILIPLLITGAAWLMVWDAAKVYPVEAPPVWQTLLRTVVVHLTALVIGMGQRLWRAVARHYSVPPALVDGVRDAWRFLLRLSLAAMVVLLALLAFGWSRQTELLAEFPNLSRSGLVALIALSVGYLPNAVIATAAVLMGSEFHVGEGSVSLFSIHLVPLPPLPIAAAIPGAVAPWAPALLLITAGLASWVMVKARPNPTRALGAAVGAALIALTANYLGGGELGWYGATGASLLATAVLAAVWLAALGLATAGALAMTAMRDRRAQQREEEAAEAEAAAAAAVADPAEEADATVEVGTGEDDATEDPDAAVDDATPVDDATEDETETEEAGETGAQDSGGIAEQAGEEDAREEDAGEKDPGEEDVEEPGEDLPEDIEPDSVPADEPDEPEETEETDSVDGAGEGAGVDKQAGPFEEEPGERG